MMFSRKRQKEAAPRTAMVERLDPRLILDAPLMLASDGLVLADPTPDELLEPAVFAEPEPAATVPPSDESDGPEPDESEPLPKVDAKSGGKSGPTVPMTTMSSGTLGTASVSVWPLGGVDEDGDPGTNYFRFRGESCAATNPASSITVYFSLGGTATPSQDFSGSTILAGYLVISMSGSQTNKSGTVDVPFSVQNDQIDEVTETLWVDPTSATSDTGAPVTILPPHSEPAGITDDDVEWAAGDPIEGTIMGGGGANPTIPINHTRDLTFVAMDKDRKKDGGVWSDFLDDVISGNTAENHHVKWTANAGTFIHNGAEVTTAYGTAATYKAPDYQEGQDVRNVTITVTVDDFNRGEDKEGFDDDALQVQQGLQVWQITLSVTQEGQTSGDYSGPAMLDRVGGTDLGWVEPGVPQGATGYHGNTQLTGSLPAPAPPSGYSWKQEKRGVAKHKVNGAWVMDVDTEGKWELEGVNAFQDTDARNPDGHGGDTRKIFFLDAPGARTALGNQVPQGWTEIQHSMLFRTSVQFGGYRVSNEEAWSVAFKLTAGQNGIWAVEPGHTP